MKKLAATTAAIVLAASTHAELKSYRVVLDPPQPVNPWGGGPPAITRVDLFVPDHGVVAGIEEVCFDMHYTWVGDLRIDVLNRETGAAATLFDRPGVPQSFFGDSADLDGEYCFRDGLAALPEDTPGPLVPPGAFGPATPLGAFAGADKWGQWSLIVAVHAAGDFGSVRGWSIRMENTPEPASLALLACGAMLPLRRRR